MLDKYNQAQAAKIVEQTEAENQKERSFFGMTTGKIWKILLLKLKNWMV